MVCCHVTSYVALSQHILWPFVLFKTLTGSTHLALPRYIVPFSRAAVGATTRFAISVKAYLVVSCTPCGIPSSGRLLPPPSSVRAPWRWARPRRDRGKPIVIEDNRKSSAPSCRLVLGEPIWDEMRGASGVGEEGEKEGRERHTSNSYLSQIPLPFSPSPSLFLFFLILSTSFYV